MYIKYNLMPLSKSKILDSIEGHVYYKEARAYFAQEWIGRYMISSDLGDGVIVHTKVNL